MERYESSGNRLGHSGLGVCWIVYGLLRLIFAIWLVTFAPVATVMFGALLVRVAHDELAMGTFHALYGFAIVLSIVCGVVGLLAGISLLRATRPSRLAVVAAFLSLSDLPLGIALGIYTLLTQFVRRETSNP